MTQSKLAERALLHAALGDESRLAIAEDLRVSDRSPKEIAARLAMPSNLLAHHLDVLEEAGAIERSVSAGDARRRYVRLSSAAADLMGPPPPMTRRNVLFVCTRNSARSQLAAALWGARTGCAAQSAGTKPAPAVHPGAVAAARRTGLSLDGAAPRGLGRIPRGVQVITVCDLAHEEVGSDENWWHWSIPAPSASRRATAFDAVIHDLNERMNRLGVLPLGEVATTKDSTKRRDTTR